MTNNIPEYDHDSFRSEFDITFIRETMDWSQEQMADHMGCHRSKISRWESGHAVIDKLAAKEYWRMHFELGLHEKHTDKADAPRHRESAL